MKHIGWIGLGNMGTPMASNLSKAGFPLTVFNRSIEKTNRLKIPLSQLPKTLQN